MWNTSHASLKIHPWLHKSASLSHNAGIPVGGTAGGPVEGPEIQTVDQFLSETDNVSFEELNSEYVLDHAHKWQYTQIQNCCKDKLREGSLPMHIFFKKWGAGRGDTIRDTGWCLTLTTLYPPSNAPGFIGKRL